MTCALWLASVVYIVLVWLVLLTLCLYATMLYVVLVCLLTMYLYASMLYVVLVWLADPVPLCLYAVCCVGMTCWPCASMPLCSMLCLCDFWPCTPMPICSMLCWCDLLTLYLYAPLLYVASVWLLTLYLYVPMLYVVFVWLLTLYLYTHMLYVVLAWLADTVPLYPCALCCVGVTCWPCTPIPLCCMLCWRDLLTLYLYTPMLYDVLVWLADTVPLCSYALCCDGVTCWPCTSMPLYSMLCCCALLTFYVYAPILYVVLVWLADPMLYVVPQLNHRAAFRSTVVDWHLVITRFVRSVMTTLIMTRWSAPGTWWWPLWLQRGRSPWLITLLNIPEVLNQSLLSPQPTKANPTTNAEEARIAMPTKTKQIRRMRVRFFSKLHLTNKRGYNHTKMF